MNGETEPDKGEKSAQQPMRACKCGTRSTVEIFIVFYLTFGSCHLDRARNVKIGVECQIFVTAVVVENVIKIR